MAERPLDPERLGDHIDRLYRAAWGLCGSREEAEDLVQDTFARVLARPRFLRSDDDLGYLLRVMRNTFVSRHRTAMRRPRTEAIPEGFEPPDPRTGDRPEERLEGQALFQAISELPDDFRDTIVAVDVVGLSYAEAGKLLGAKEATITSRLHRARSRVIAAMREADARADGQDRGRRGVV